MTSNEACHAEDHYLSYLPCYYCAGGGHIKWLMMPLYLAWMLVLFYALSEVAEGFLVPSVEVRRACEPGQGYGREGLTFPCCLQGWCHSRHPKAGRWLFAPHFEVRLAVEQLLYSHCCCLHPGGRGWLAVLPVQSQGTVTTECLAGCMRTSLPHACDGLACHSSSPATCSPP